MTLFAGKKNITNHLLGYWRNLGKGGGITIMTFIATQNTETDLYFDQSD